MKNSSSGRVRDSFGTDPSSFLTISFIEFSPLKPKKAPPSLEKFLPYIFCNPWIIAILNAGKENAYFSIF
jgi:hypothetical protein